MKKIVWIICITFVGLFSSCSDNDYVNVIPRNSIALISFDASQTTPSASLLSELDSCGVDLQSKVYFFETSDGMLGLCAKMDDVGKMVSWLKTKVNSGDCEQLMERSDINYAFYKHAWQIGYNESMVLILGPIVATQQPQTQMQIANYFHQDESRSIRASRMFQRLDSIGGSVSMVAQTVALPERYVAPFTLGAPPDADPSEIFIAAQLTADDRILHIKGNTFSFNKRLEKALRTAKPTFRPLGAQLAEKLCADDEIAILMNAKGQALMPLLHQDKALKALMAGMNLTIDIDSILRSVDGDMLFRFGKGKAEFLCGKELEALSSNPESLPFVRLTSNKRLCMVLRLTALGDEAAITAASFLQPLFGNINTIVYTTEP